MTFSPGTGEERPTLQTRLEQGNPRRRSGLVGGDSAPSGVNDLSRLLLQLESEGRIHRDRGLGRIYHWGGVSFRENEPTNSLHLSAHGNRLDAHVDHVSPLSGRGPGAPRYSLRHAVAHNIGGMTHDLARVLRGRQGDHRCQLNCEWVSDPSESEPQEHDLLDPRSSSWSLQLEARVEGTFDDERLRASLRTVLGSEGRGVEMGLANCADDAALDAVRRRLQSEVVPSWLSPPLRICLARHPEGDVLMLNLNHAAADRLGALRVLDSVAEAYAHGVQPAPPLDFLATRPVPVRPASAPVSRLTRAYRTVVERLRDAMARPARLAPEGATDDAAFGFHLVRLSREDTVRLIDVTRPGTSRNILMAGLHLAIGQWNLDHGSPGRQIGVLAPVDLRPPDWPEDKIGNFSVTTRVSTSRRQRSGPAAALKAVTAQTTRNKRTRTGISLIAALDRTGLLPVWAKQSVVVLQPLTGNTLVDTALLAHLGWLEKPPRFGRGAGETIELWFSVPARAPLALCVGTATVGGCLHLTFRYPRRLFSPEAAASFAECYLANLRSIGAPGVG